MRWSSSALGAGLGLEPEELGAGGPGLAKTVRAGLAGLEGGWGLGGG